MKTKSSYTFKLKKSMPIGCILALFATSVPAQEVNDEVTMVQTIWGSEKRELMIDYMNIPEAQAMGFWKVYEDYEAARRQLAKDRILVIDDYVSNFTSLTEQKANELATKILANTVSEGKLRKKYYTKFKKASSAIDAAKFLQLDAYIQNTIRLALQDELPFIGDLESKRKD